MPKAYSIDLRDRAVTRVMAGETVRSVASVLQVSVASVVKWSQRFRRTGSAAPGPMHGHRPRLLLAHRDWVIARTANDQPFTLRGLQAELVGRGVVVDYRTVWRFVHAEGLSFKKKCAAQRTGSP
jgi:transposase